MLVLFVFSACTEKELDPNDADKSYARAKEPYVDGNYDLALLRLGEFKSRFPYSKYAKEAELFIANSHFELGHYPEATAAYQQFIKLHPKHPKVPFALFRIGESYWADAPEAVDREQDLTSKAVSEWKRLIEQHPDSEFSTKAKSLVQQGERRMVEALDFVADFYCRQEIWHSCAYRYIAMADEATTASKDLLVKALNKAAFAFEKMASELNEENKDTNLYYRKMSKEELLKKAEEFKEKAVLLPNK